MPRNLSKTILTLGLSLSLLAVSARADNASPALAKYTEPVDKAVCKINGLTLHPYWERGPNCGVHWVLGE